MYTRMNWYHRRLCSSAGWAAFMADKLLSSALDDLDLGSQVLELGPGYGASTRALADPARTLTAIEPDHRLASRLRAELGGIVEIIDGDATDMAFATATFSAVVCFTMLHHLSSAAAQDRLFAEAARVLQPGGIFAGTDSATSTRFRLIHLGDTCTPVDPLTLPGRLAAVGFTGIDVRSDPGLTYFTARVPEGPRTSKEPAYPTEPTYPKSPLPEEPRTRRDKEEDSDD